MRNDGRLTAQKGPPLPDAVVTVGLVTAVGSAARANHRNLQRPLVPVRPIEEHVSLTGRTAQELHRIERHSS